jgi:hypothetical protein
MAATMYPARVTFRAENINKCNGYDLLGTRELDGVCDIVRTIMAALRTGHIVTYVSEITVILSNNTATPTTSVEVVA